MYTRYILKTSVSSVRTFQRHTRLVLVVSGQNLAGDQPNFRPVLADVLDGCVGGRDRESDHVLALQR